MTTATQQSLQSMLDRERVNAGALGMNVGVSSSCGTWIGSSGDAALDHSGALDAQSRFRIYSITKTFTSALVFKLIDAHQLSLDDPLSRWYPDFPSADTILIRHLLSHTSGIFDCLTDPAVVAGRSQVWDHDRLISIAAQHGLQFTPGSKAQYVNTNFLILGRVIEKVTGKTYASVLREQILQPLGLTQTFLAGSEAIDGGFVEGTRYDVTQGMLVDATNAWDDSLTWSAGALVSTAGDQLAWFQALFGGQVVSAGSLQQMETPPTLADGSASPFAYDLEWADSAAGRYFAHEGGGSGVDLLAQTAFGFHAHLGFMKDPAVAIVVLANTGTSDIAGARNGALALAVSVP